MRAVTQAGSRRAANDEIMPTFSGSLTVARALLRAFPASGTGIRSRANLAMWELSLSPRRAAKAGTLVAVPIIISLRQTYSFAARVVPPPSRSVNRFSSSARKALSAWAAMTAASIALKGAASAPQS